MKITKRQLRKIIQEEAAHLTELEIAQAGGGDEMETRTKMIKGLEIAGFDPELLKSLPSSKQQLQAMVAIITDAIQSAAAGKAIPAAKKVDRATQPLLKQ